MKLVTYYTAIAAAVCTLALMPAPAQALDIDGQPRTSERTVTGQTRFYNDDLGTQEVMGQGYSEPERTVHRTVRGETFFPNGWFLRPEHDEFLPYHSNFDIQNSQPAAWDGQDWDSSMWDKNWTPEIALKKFFKAQIFTGLYHHIDRKTRKNKTAGTPVIELGRTFYKLSDLDQRRTLKLLVDNTDGLKDAPVIGLIDWYTKKLVGAYRQNGSEQTMFLN
jgi:hypothetical protein